jgi:hypothetical protein
VRMCICAYVDLCVCGFVRIWICAYVYSGVCVFVRMCMDPIPSLVAESDIRAC